MRTIVLAAGQGFQLDGCVKLLIKDPKNPRNPKKKQNPKNPKKNNF